MIDHDFKEEAAALNRITAAIGNKAASFRERRIRMPLPQKEAEKKLIRSMIDDGLELAERINPKPVDLMMDLRTLRKEFE